MFRLEQDSSSIKSFTHRTNICFIDLHSFIHPSQFSFSFQFSFIYCTLGYSIYIVYVTNRNKITDKRRKRKKLMVLAEVCGGQRSLAFELTQVYYKLTI